MGRGWGGLPTLLCVLLSAGVRLPPQASPPLHEFGSRPTCEQCRIDIQRGISLALPSDSLSFWPFVKLTKLPAGRGYLASRFNESAVPGLFDASGRFVRLIARRGQGPGELTGANAILVGPGDSVWVTDGPRRHLFDPALRYVRTDVVRGLGYDVIATSNGIIVTGGGVGGADVAGLPLQIRDASSGAVLRAFRTDDPSIDPRKLAAVGDDASRYLNRQLTAGLHSDFWAYNNFRFLLEHYDASGELLARARHALDGWYGDASKREPSLAAFSGLALHDIQVSTAPRIVWLVYHPPRPTYSPPAAGKLDILSWARGHDVVVEAFDAERLEVVAFIRVSSSLA